MTPARLRCVVPFCRRTTGKFPASEEWLCIDHWKLVDRGLKLLRRKRFAVMDRAIERCEAETALAQARHRRGGSEDEVWRWANRAANAIARRRRFARGVWRRMKAQAIERATGL